MRALLVPAIAMAMSVSAAALAQGQQAKQGGDQQSKQMSTRSYKEVEDALKQAGIQEVRTLNAAYLVSAVTKDGEQVTFVVDPPPTSGSAGSNASQKGGSQQGNSQQAGGQGASSSQQMALRGQQQVRDDLTKAGFKSVQILDATYLAAGKTKGGDRVTMMIDPSASAGTSGSSGSGGSPSGSGQSGSSAQQGTQKQ